MLAGFIVDLSDAQPNVDFRRLKKAGCIGVVIKATQGLTYTNSHYLPQRRACIAAGLPVIAYHFAGDYTGPATPPKYNDPVAEANFFRRNAGDGFARVLDVETNTNTPWHTTFLKALDSSVNNKFQRLIYGGKTAISPQTEALKWVADYDSNNGHVGTYPGIGVCWQYTSMGNTQGADQAPGVPYRVDISKWMGTKQQFVQVFGVKPPNRILTAIRHFFSPVPKA